MWIPTKLRIQANALRKHQLDVVASKHILIREDGRPFFFGFAKNMPMTSSWLGKTAVFTQRPFELVSISEDVLLWERLESEVRCQIMDKFLIRYRVREQSLSSMTSTRGAEASVRTQVSTPWRSAVLALHFLPRKRRTQSTAPDTTIRHAATACLENI